jgi:hypothetical protein
MAETSTAPSAFDQSQDWSNPLDSMGTPPKLDYGKALEAKKEVTQKELGAVTGVMNRNDADMKKYERVADKKFDQLEKFDPDQIKPWNAQEEQQKYKDDPLSAFGSFAMVASLGLAAITKTPFINSMNAMAGVINGRQEAKSQEYDRAYKAWQDNTKVFLDRFNMIKTQVTDAQEMMRIKGEEGKTKLANTLTKYGLAQDLALLNAGYDDVLATKWAAQVKAVEGMAESREKIERLHTIRQALSAEDAQRAELGMKPMTPQEKIEQEQYLTDKHTPEQQAFHDVYHSLIKEHPNATAQEKLGFYQQAKAFGRNAQSAASAGVLSDFVNAVPNASQEDLMIVKTALDTKGAKAPQMVARMTEAIDNIKAAAETGSPMSPEEISQTVRAAATGTGGKDQGGLDLAAENYIKTGQFPSRNWEANRPILDLANQKLKERGIDPKDLPKLQQEFKSQQVAIQRFLSGPQGQQTSAINMAEHHLETLRTLTAAMDNGDFTLANWLSNKAAREMGRPEPNNAMLGAQIVGTEIVRAMGVAGAGSVEERGGLAQGLASDSASPEQMSGAADTAEKLLAGKLFSLRLAFPNATGLPLSRFDDMLSNRTKSILLPLVGEDKAVTTADKVGGGTATTPPVNMLQEGMVTKFKNGTAWTLKDGKPLKVTQ